MPSNEPFISFDVQDYQEAIFDNCRVVIASERTIAICLSAIRSASYYNTRWASGGLLGLSPSEQSTVFTWYHTAIRELVMSCDIQADIARIAQALEDIRDVITNGVPVSPQNGNLKPYVDQLEDVNQEIARAIGGTIIPVDEVP